MSLRINKEIFKLTHHHSDNLAQLGFIAHQYSQTGLYQLDVFRHDKLIDSIHILVDNNSSEQQVTLDLAASSRASSSQTNGCGCQNQAKLELARNGYVLFHVGKGSGGYSVKSYPMNEQAKGQIFNSKKLKSDDLFGLTLIQPGHYHVTENGKDLLFAFDVKSVKPCEKKYVPADPIHVDLDKADSYKDIDMTQGQGIVFRSCQTDSISVEMHHHGKQAKQERKTKVARWTNSKSAPR
jgi:hypothetical protein